MQLAAGTCPSPGLQGAAAGWGRSGCGGTGDGHASGSGHTGRGATCRGSPFLHACAYPFALRCNCRFPVKCVLTTLGLAMLNLPHPVKSTVPVTVAVTDYSALQRVCNLLPSGSGGAVGAASLTQVVLPPPLHLPE